MFPVRNFSCLTILIRHIRKLMKLLEDYLTLLAPIPQNGQTHSNNLLRNCLSAFDHFVGLALNPF